MIEYSNNSFELLVVLGRRRIYGLIKGCGIHTKSVYVFTHISCEAAFFLLVMKQQQMYISFRLSLFLLSGACVLRIDKRICLYSSRSH